jgi:hypothetical protein
MLSSSQEGSKDYYFAIWTTMLHTLLGWSAERVRIWAERYDTYLDNPEDIFYHQTPQYWVTSLLIPEGLRARLTNQEQITLRAQLLGAFNDSYHYHFPVDTDWQLYRVKLNQILAEYNAQLPIILQEEGEP